MCDQCLFKKITKGSICTSGDKVIEKFEIRGSYSASSVRSLSIERKKKVCNAVQGECQALQMRKHAISTMKTRSGSIALKGCNPLRSEREMGKTKINAAERR